MGGCLTPGKKAFQTKEGAVVGSYAIGMGHLFPYLCACGQWHLSSRRNAMDEVPDEYIKLLQDASDKEFMSLVRAEAHGKARPEEAAALRTPALRFRWSSALKDIAADMQRIMETAALRDDPTTRRWRQKHQRRIMEVSARRKEARYLVGESLKLQKNDSGEQRAQRRAQAQDAGRRAIDRLIEAHIEEFETYLAEEKAADAESEDAREE